MQTALVFFTYSKIAGLGKCPCSEPFLQRSHIIHKTDNICSSNTYNQTNSVPQSREQKWLKTDHNTLCLQTVLSNISLTLRNAYYHFCLFFIFQDFFSITNKTIIICRLTGDTCWLLITQNCNKEYDYEHSVVVGSLKPQFGSV